MADGVWKITSTHRSEPHLVNSLRPSCTCRSFMRTHFPCRHIFQLLGVPGVVQPAQGLREYSLLHEGPISRYSHHSVYRASVNRGPRFTGPQPTGPLGLPGLLSSPCANVPRLTGLFCLPGFLARFRFPREVNRGTVQYTRMISILADACTLYIRLDEQSIQLSCTLK